MKTKEMVERERILSEREARPHAPAINPIGLAAQVLSDPSASYWLKDALRAALNRDACDALGDAEVLALALKDNLQLATTGAR